MISQIVQSTEAPMTLVACDCDHDPWCESCRGDSWWLEPVLSVEEFVMLLAGDQWEVQS